MVNSDARTQPSFRRILMATDFSRVSEAAFHAALELCCRFSATLFLVHVHETLDKMPSDSEEQHPEFAACERARLLLQQWLEEARARGVACSSIVVHGNAWDAILQVAGQIDAELIVLGSKAVRGVERLVFGSTAEVVMRKSVRPVLTIGPLAALNPLGEPCAAPVIFATDFHRTTTGALAYAASFSKNMNTDVHCVHVLPRTLQCEQRADVVPLILAEALQQLANGVVERPVYAITYGSEISNAIVEYAREHSAGLIVLGVRQASMLAAHMPPHIAYRIVAEAPCPVLTMAFAPECEESTAACTL